MPNVGVAAHLRQLVEWEYSHLLPWIPVLLFVLVYVTNYLFHAVGKPRLYFHPKSIHRKVVRRTPVLRRTYWPTFWLANGHLQTIWGGLNPFSVSMEYNREMLKVEAPNPERYAGKVALDWAVQRNPLPDAAPVVVILHGLTGGSRSSYVKKIVRKFVVEFNYRTVVFNFRGCGGTVPETPQAFCAAYTDDLHQVVEYIHSRYPEAPLYAVGYSLGSNILVKYLGEQGSKTHISAAVSVANPFNLVESNRHLHSSTCRELLYSRNLAKNLKTLAASWRETFRGHVDLEQMHKIRTIEEFDDQMTCRVFGYPNVRAYYKDASCVRLIDEVGVPLLCLNAMDDPICPSRSIPYDAWQKNRNVCIMTTNTGGHSMDWYEGSFSPNPGAWSPEVIASYIHTVHDILMHHRADTESIAKSPAASPLTNGASVGMRRRIVVTPPADHDANDYDSDEENERKAQAVPDQARDRTPKRTPKRTPGGSIVDLSERVASWEDCLNQVEQLVLDEENLDSSMATVVDHWGELVEEIGGMYGKIDSVLSSQTSMQSEAFKRLEKLQAAMQEQLQQLD